MYHLVSPHESSETIPYGDHLVRYNFMRESSDRQDFESSVLFPDQCLEILFRAQKKKVPDAVNSGFPSLTCALLKLFQKKK